MPQVLYSLRTEIDAEGASRYRITKFVDGEVESSYHTSREACECPAGVRPTCRHRQMLPQMLNADIVNTHWFWSHDHGFACDFEGNDKRILDSIIEPAPQPAEPAPAPTPTPTATIQPAAKFVRRI